jgi:hypothetical protein
LRDVARRIEATTEDGLGVPAITHYACSVSCAPTGSTLMDGARRTGGPESPTSSRRRGTRPAAELASRRRPEAERSGSVRRPGF